MKERGLVLLFSLSFSVVSLAGSAAENGRQGLKVGVGVSVINPFLDVPLAGYYYSRMPLGVHDDLHAKALVFDNGHDQIVLVACDLVELPRAAVEDARLRIQRAFGIPPDHVLTWIRREFHCFPSKVAENWAFVSEMLQQSLDFHKHNFNPAGVLIYESDGVSHPPTFE